VCNLFNTAVPNKAGVEAKRLSAALHSFQAKNKVLQYENEGLKESLTTNVKHRKKNKHLDLQQHKEIHSKTVFWSPSTIWKSFALKAVKQRKADKL
jgi:regulator of replication initiation timing